MQTVKIAAIGLMITSMLLVLVVVSAVYSLTMHGATRWDNKKA